jgi:hypothetical protein
MTGLAEQTFGKGPPDRWFDLDGNRTTRELSEDLAQNLVRERGHEYAVTQVGEEFTVITRFLGHDYTNEADWPYNFEQSVVERALDDDGVVYERQLIDHFPNEKEAMAGHAYTAQALREGYEPKSIIPRDQCIHPFAEPRDPSMRMDADERRAYDEATIRRAIDEGLTPHSSEGVTRMSIQMAEIGEYKQESPHVFVGKLDGLRYTAPPGNYPVIGGIENGQVQTAGIVLNGVNADGGRLNAVHFYTPGEALKMVKDQQITLKRDDAGKTLFSQRMFQQDPLQKQAQVQKPEQKHALAV